MADNKDPSDQSRRVETNADKRLVLVSLTLIVIFFVTELVAAIVGDSLVLLADAGHMITDVAALALSAWAIHLAQKPAHDRWTFGFKRAEIIAAGANGLLLVAISLLIAVEAIGRLVSPHHVAGGLVLVIALIGTVINLIAVRVLARANQRSLNLRAAFAHIVTDLYAFVGTAVSGVVIVLTHWERADSIASILVVALMLWTSWGLLRDSGRILLQAAPDDILVSDVRQHLGAVDHVLDVHDLHVWTLTSGSITLSAHVTVDDDCFDTGYAPQLLDALQLCLSDHFSVTHSTFQLEPAGHVSHEDDIHQ